MVTTLIADRQVEDRFLKMTAEERALYDSAAACKSVWTSSFRAVGLVNR